MPQEIDIPITVFDGDHEFLSNFSPDSFEWRNIHWQTSEHAYQAVKTVNHEEFEYVKNADSPGQAKKRGRRIKCRADWEQIKDEVMLDILRCKFAPGTELAGKLVATGEAELVEGNYWHDCYWGRCTCAGCGNKGKNMLGKTLMQIRAELKEQKDDDSTGSG